MDANYTVQANFVVNQRSLTTSTTAGGTVTTPGIGTYWYNQGTAASLVAASDAHYHFVNWTGTGVDAGKVGNPNLADTTIIMDADYTVVANFAIDRFTLTASADANGTVQPTSVDVNYGDNQQFDASANMGYTVDKWYLDGGEIQTGGTTYTITNVTADHTVSVTFKQSQLTISGTITCAGSAPADVNGVNMVGLGVVTDVNGFYNATVSSGFSGVVIPTKEGYTFDPNTRTYTNVTTSQTGQDYNALPSDNFSDNRKGRLWSYGVEGDAAKIWLAEAGNLLNLRALNLAYLPPFCVGYWTMDDNQASTTVADSYANNKNGTAQRNTSVLHTDDGKINGALTFNGTSDYVDLGNVIGTGAYTKVAWVKRDDANSYNNIVSSDTASNAIYAPYTLSFKLTAGHNISPFKQVQDTVPLDANVWYHVAVTFQPNGSTGKMVLYKNGAEVNEASNVPVQIANTKTYIGRFSTGYLMKGAIDNVMIFNRALAPEEIAALYNQDTVPPIDLTSATVGHWKMNDYADNTVVTDDSDNGHDGTAQQNTSVLHTDGKINGALTFNGTSDYVDVGNLIGTGAYTKVAWVKRADANSYNNIVSSDTASNAIYAPYTLSFKLTAGHNISPFNQVQDTVPLAANVWYFVAVSFQPNGSTGKMVLYKNGVEVNEAGNVPVQIANTKTYIGRFSTGYWMKGAIDNVMIFNRALTAAEIAALYNQGSGTETIPGAEAPAMQQASFAPNGWRLDTSRDLAVKVDFHYGDTSSTEGWTGISVGDNANNYVSISAGSDGNAAYFYYEASVDGTTVSEKEPRTAGDGTMYVSFDSAARKFYLSHTGFGSENAYAWQATDPTQGQWGSPVDVSLGGGAAGLSIGSGKAFLDNFEMKTAGFVGWPPANDIDDDGYVDIYDLEIICENWLDSGQGDIDNSGLVDFKDLAELGLAW